MSGIRSGLGGVSLALMLTACSGGNGASTGGVITPGTGGGGGGDSDTFPQNVYALADRCVKIKADGQYIKADGTGFTAAAAAPGEPVLFYMKATGLRHVTDTLTTARYAFYTKDAQFLTGGTAVSAEDAPSDGADWTFKAVAPGAYKAILGADEEVLTADDAGALAMGASATDFARLTFEPAEGCTAYPEMPVNVAGGYTGPDSGDLVGYADIHAHMSMGSDMSDGSGDRGPSAGGVMYGHAVNRFGVTEALKDCVDMHGEGGLTTAELVLDTAPDPHDTVGWPTFVDWPARDSQLHQQMYWKWVERSWKAGQRLMVLHGTSIEALCDVAKKSNGDKTSDCTDMGVGMSQVAYAHDMQDYIDAQYGGPGKGWFRIVQNSVQAEKVIREGKMAVVPGLEFSNIFKCNVTYVAGQDEVVGCSPETIDQQIEEAWDAGVRGIFLYHDVDSALGGTGIFSFVLNLVNYYGTKGFWESYACDDADGKWSRGESGLDNGYFYGAGTTFPGWNELGPVTSNPIGSALFGAVNGELPAYPEGKLCNERGITTLGEYALAAAMKKGFVLDIDHAEIEIKQAMLDEGRKTNPDYPMISAHGGHGGFTNAQVQQMLEQGGIMYPGMINGREYISFYNRVENIWNRMAPTLKKKYPIAVGYGADQNGLANQPGPRGGENVVAIDYTQPFKLFDADAPAWSEVRKALPGAPEIAVSKLAVGGEGSKSWNADEVGVAHYGMLPDVVHQIRLESDNPKYLAGFYRSADAYVRLWRQTEEAARQRPKPVHPTDVPTMVPHPIDPTTGPLGLPAP